MPTTPTTRCCGRYFLRPTSAPKAPNRGHPPTSDSQSWTPTNLRFPIVDTHQPQAAVQGISPKRARIELTGAARIWWVSAIALLLQGCRDRRPPIGPPTLGPQSWTPTNPGLPIADHLGVQLLGCADSAKKSALGPKFWWVSGVWVGVQYPRVSARSGSSGRLRDRNRPLDEPRQSLRNHGHGPHVSMTTRMSFTPTTPSSSTSPDGPELP